ncbi:ChuX/HutX family heme-like substrate-binding protein [Magnetospirillum sp. 64-120]|uniref:hemin-degrading factor n=1 Tax=Magnetospirillum sp. 64-120 TaxID=1895778 RepID=UPI000AA61D09|nr:ChuX/HutX family heme-like substrate-binding protein [Magnetospirillum sp. 64-120]
MNSNLTALWCEIAAGTAKGYARDLAAQAGVSEAQVVAAGCGGNGVTRLDVDWIAQLPILESLGEVKIITRNDSIVHEKVGSFAKISVTGTMGLVLNGEVDLRLFLGHWNHTFHVCVDSRHGPRQAIQVFDIHGEAVHKIYRTDATDAAAWDALVSAFTAADQSPTLAVAPPRRKLDPRADDAIDVSGLRASWAAMTDVHHFHSMLQEYGVDRHQALRLAGTDYAREVTGDALSQVLRAVQASQLPFMIFVGNTGCIQIHTGPIQRVMEKDAWVNVMDPRFNLHARADLIHSAWVVVKPTREGVITALELYDSDNRNVAILVGERQPGTPERADWRALLHGLPGIDASKAA